MESPGQHHLADFWGCRDLDLEAWREALLQAVSAMGATLVSLHLHPFQPQGATGVAILSESHLAFHTWPEDDFVAIDLFTCGQHVRPQAALNVLRQALAPNRESIRVLSRGGSAATSHAHAFSFSQSRGT